VSVFHLQDTEMPLLCELHFEAEIESKRDINYKQTLKSGLFTEQLKMRRSIQFATRT
jgi:hypothetical protein